MHQTAGGIYAPGQANDQQVQQHMAMMAAQQQHIMDMHQMLTGNIFGHLVNGSTSEAVFEDRAVMAFNAATIIMKLYGIKFVRTNEPANS